GTARSPWPDAICGSSLEFLQRVHGRDSAAELRATALSSKPEPDSEQPVGPPADAPSPVEAPSATATTSDSSAAVADAATLDALSPPTPAQQIIRWLTFDGQVVQGQPPPERPELPQRSAA